MRGWGKEGDSSPAPRLRHTWRLPYEATIAPGCKLMLDLCAALLPAIEPVSQTAGNAERRLLARVGLMRVATPVSALGPWARTTACRAITARTVSAARVVRSPVSLQLLNPSSLQALRVLPRVCAGVRRGLMTSNRSIGLNVLRGYPIHYCNVHHPCIAAPRTPYCRHQLEVSPSRRVRRCVSSGPTGNRHRRRWARVLVKACIDRCLQLT